MKHMKDNADPQQPWLKVSNCTRPMAAAQVAEQLIRFASDSHKKWILQLAKVKANLEEVPIDEVLHTLVWLISENSAPVVRRKTSVLKTSQETSVPKLANIPPPAVTSPRSNMESPTNSTRSSTSSNEPCSRSSSTNSEISNSTSTTPRKSSVTEESDSAAPNDGSSVKLPETNDASFSPVTAPVPTNITRHHAGTIIQGPKVVSNVNGSGAVGRRNAIKVAKKVQKNNTPTTGIPATEE